MVGKQYKTEGDYELPKGSEKLPELNESAGPSFLESKLQGLKEIRSKRR